VKTRQYVDAELHLLRSVAQAQPGQARQQIETARFNLYVAFESRDQDSARRWAAALRVALEPLGKSRELALDALGRIESAIEKD
jgi:hypothetical protein